VKLILHYPFIDYNNLLYIENQTYNTYIEAFQAYKALYSHPLDFYTDPKPDPAKLLDLDDNSNTDSEDNSEDNKARNGPLDTTELLLYQRPGRDRDLIQFTDSLVTRELNYNYN
jgi:hypothetical protein